MRPLVACGLAAIVLLGCASPTASGAGEDAAHDADARVDASPPGDAGRTQDAGTDASAASRGTRFTLRDGTAITGELIATYDHSSFWIEPSDELTFAVFREGLFAPYPDDRSVALVSSLDVLDRSPVALDALPYRDALRARGFVLARPPLDGVSYVITGGESYHLEENGFGHFALDFVRTGDDGLAFTGDGTANEDYLAFAEPVFMPTGGVVVEVVRDAPDNPPGVFDLAAVNNLIGVHFGGGYYLYLLHFRQNSIASDVVVGAALEAGHYLGAVGNSGVSTAPHLHVAFLAVEPGSSPLRSWSVPVELANVHTSRAMGVPATHHEYTVVSGGTWISAEVF